MEVIYRSTRSNGAPVTASQAILKGLSDDGGLFVPDHIPTLDKSLKELAGMTYQQVAYEVMKNEPYFTAEHRRQLVNVLNMKILYRNKKMFVCNMIENYVEQYASFIMERCENIVFPDIDEFVGEELDGL